MINDMLLKLKTDKTFIKKTCDRTTNNVKAALVTVASKMAIPSEIVSEADALDVLMQVYGLVDNSEVRSLIGMEPQFVRETIGYSVDFNDASQAISAYEANRSTYDDYYRQVAQKSQEMKSSLDYNNKSM